MKKILELFLIQELGILLYIIIFRMWYDRKQGKRLKNAKYFNNSI